MAATKKALDFSVTELDRFLAFVEINKAVLLDDSNKLAVIQLKSKLWQQLAEELSAMGVSMRSSKDVKQKWENMKKAVKKEYEQIFVPSKKPTGGGKAPILSERAKYIIESIGLEFKPRSQIVGGFGLAMEAELSDYNEREEENTTPVSLGSINLPTTTPKTPDSASVVCRKRRHSGTEEAKETVSISFEVLTLQKQVLLAQAENLKLEQRKLGLEIFVLEEKQRQQITKKQILEQQQAQLLGYN